MTGTNDRLEWSPRAHLDEERMTDVSAEYFKDGPPVFGSSAAIHEVHSFWDTEACGSQFAPQSKGEKEFYEAYRRYRYSTEWHIPQLIASTEPQGKSVLEIGVGNGADGILFSQSGARYTGVDLTETALRSARKHFELLGLRGTFQIENAERLSFPDDSFDIIYAYGVLHHTPNPTRAIQEVYRVLRPGGTALIMLYNKHSFNYYIRIMAYMRLRVLARIISRATRWAHDRSSLAPIESVRGNRDLRIWQLHYQNFLREGWSYLGAKRFIHHCTDGPTCPVAYVFTRAKARKLFSRFKRLKVRVVHFPLNKYLQGRFLSHSLEKLFASTMGWYLIIKAVK